ncbi:MAG: tRNA (adenosine(37)-N6)-threonylcarbamoyltransferase complex transferase subunit TsaD [Nitrososphaeria archaeon]|nr:tRNA (adenosine(37)-N6)-threonylcarbamoyltransferase complex transferase subunit TsaD [Nitrososphaeria archaeon]NDB51721.1 tRNA (adenosine(37)-N6)-threonylcarbamoyltransferase complex transferase subunit TsaD [Nitrosopumilaceae archaeon]NDB88584.1 tRNA (adenosine(37)-N6)-threonylcarbamoyltransferase complex transferase subunit TsaD [Nitrososphaerota archaeon]NDB46472.1 tRNA (adenosine(37)-N6)-threonylcarbamoyltransferase complex transferase subunit TsaD [Nitrososphaeria archaeon]NDB92430.1 t
MLCLGIESTAHTFSCAIVEKQGNKGKIRSDVRKIYRPPDGQGIHPREASRHHIECSADVLSECVKKAGISIKDIDIISYSAGPGLGPCLRVSGVVARTVSSYYKIPIYPVNHAIGHIELGKMLTGAKDPLVLLVSGGHTMLAALKNKKWRIFGETLDITLGQLLDQFGRSLGFASPCGKKIEELSRDSTKYVELPYVVKGNDVSFSGLMSAAKRISKNKQDACYSLQETAFAMIGEAAERALSFTEKKELLIVGGVAANKRLSQIFKQICARQKAKFFVAPLEYSGDCGSQIAWTGLLEATAKNGANLKDTFVRQSWRLDTVQIDY